MGEKCNLFTTAIPNPEIKGGNTDSRDHERDLRCNGQAYPKASSEQRGNYRLEFPKPKIT
jgi:hypothetical protein